MALPNPAINPPRLPSPTKRSLHSRSPSQSPVRQHARDFDPLLRDLSPSATLRAFSARPQGRSEDQLTRSIETASPAERALGLQAAQACSDLRAWAQELESWEWPDTFEVPEPARKKQRMSGISIFSRSDSTESQREAEDEYWGSLSSHTVLSHERRIEEIRDGLDEIDVEELKDFVLSAHSQAATGDADIDDSIGAIGAATDLKRLDDFTALITATILQALPYLSRLTRLLHSWSVRLSILRSTPRYLQDLKQARTDLDHGWASLAVSPNISKASFTQETMEEMKGVISSQVHSLGKRLDRFLDELEGRSEVVPDQWIDDFEELEHQYAEWVMQAERKVIEGEWKTARQEDGATLKALEGDDGVRGVNRGLGVDMDAGAPATAISTLEQSDEDVKIQDLRSIGSPTVATTTTVIASSVAALQASSTNTMTHTMTSGPTTTTTTTITPTSPRHPNREAFVGLDAEEQDADEDRSSPPRAKHVPIVVSYPAASNKDRDAEIPPQSEPADMATGSSRDPSPFKISVSRSKSESSETPDVKQRAAFLNGDIEKSDGLLKAKPAPIVRPFEHASNAFTRLFKRDGKESDELTPPRSSSLKILGGSERRSGSSKRSENPPSNNSDKTSQMSRASSGKHSTGSSSKKEKTEYMDMIRSTLRSSDGSKKSRPTTPASKRDREKNQKMGYADLVPIADEPRVLFPDSSGRPIRPTTPSPKEKRRHKKTLSSEITALPQPTLPKSQYDTLPKAIDTKVPETYKPTGLSSPFHSPIDEPEQEFPEDWPLSTSVTPLDISPDKENLDPIQAMMTEQQERSVSAPDRDMARETKMPNDAIESDDFENLFVQSMPNSSANNRGRVAVARNTSDRDVAANDVGSAPAVEFSIKPAADQSLLRSGGVSKTRVLDWNDSPSMPRPVSIVHEEEGEESPGSSSGDSNNPASDNAAGYFGGVKSKGTAAVLMRSKSSQPNSTPPVSPMMLKLRIPDSTVSDSEVVDNKEGPIRRASITSIESHPRSSLRSIDVPRRSSTGSVPGHQRSASAGATPVSARSPSGPRTPSHKRSASSPMSYKGMISFPTPPSVPPRGSSLRASLDSQRNSIDRAGPSSSPPAANDESMPTLNTLVSKLRKGRSNSARNRQADTITASPIAEKSPLDSGGDNFDRHVSEVLDRVHAPIKFKTRPGAVTPAESRAPDGASSSKSKAARIKPKSSKTNMTLAPAEISPKKSTPADPEVKLYHLTQAGRSEPIKLFVRLVGEGERVMVRVGGGWADLADYLRQYAEHHGSRTVSESVLELQTANSSSNAAKRSFSGPASAVDSKSLSRVSTLERPRTRDSDKEQPRFTMGDSEEELNTYLTEQRSTPVSAKSTSRPSTANAFSSRPESPAVSSSPAVATPSGGGLSMAGPNPGGKIKAGLPEQKARWVEGMIEKVNKSASAEKNREEKEKHFAEMGRVGGVRRVMFRSSSAAGGESAK